MNRGPAVYGRLISVLLLSGVAGLNAQTNAPPSLTLWDTRASASVAFGYRDNLLFSSVTSEQSAFFRSSVDASLMRLTETDAFFMLFLLGEDTRYLESTAVEYEQLFSTTALLARPFSPYTEAGVEGGYTYQHQIFDASESEVNLRRILVLGHRATLEPYLSYNLSDQWTGRVEAQMARQIYETQLDDYWEGMAQLSLSRAYGYRSEASLRYSRMIRIYDTRAQLELDGIVRPRSSLTYRQDMATVELKHYFDAEQHWRSTTRASGMINRDNGSGFFNYHRLLLRQQLRWTDEEWSLSALARLGWYRYRFQQINGEKRERSYAVIGLTAHRALGNHWNIFAEGESEWNESNDPLDEYRSWMIAAGAGMEF